MKKYIKINEKDNVAVALEQLEAGMHISDERYGEIVLKEDIKAGHKVALCDIKKDGPVLKYGNPIGHASADISTGEWVHVHNVKTNLSGRMEYTYEPQASALESWEHTSVTADKEDLRIPCFKGFRRKNGVGVRNEIRIIPTVGCVNDIARELETAGRSILESLPAGRPEIETADRSALGTISEGNDPKGVSVDAVVAMTHPYGCSQMGDDQENTAAILAAMAKHPNCGGALIISLGCENNNLEHMKPYLEGIDESRVRYLVCQEAGDELQEGAKLLNELIELAMMDKRVDIPASELIVGLKCGGSDGLSGITANPLVGRFSDVLTGLGGTAVLTEVPEMFGAEHLLMNRAVNVDIFNKTVSLINDFKEYYERHNQVIYENPSPGNKAGGITTLEDKSLGCVQKSGSSRVCDVIRYGERVSSRGLNLLEGPGNDMVAVTALAASGAHIILFTTGRGTPLSSPVPTVKISTNSALAEHKANWIDFDAGRLISQTDGDITNELFEYVLRVASGEKVKSEAAGYHSMTIFKQGVTL